MKNCIRRFEPALVLFLLLSGVLALVDLDNGALSALGLFVLFPAFVFFLCRALWLMVRDLFRVCVQGKPWPEEAPSLFQRTAAAWRRYWEIRLAMSAEDRARLWFWRLLGVLLFLLGLLLAARDWTWPGTLLLMAGVAAWAFVDPAEFTRTVNRSDKARAVDCPEDLTIDRLYRAFRLTDTMLGTPYTARVFPHRGDCLVFGPNEWGVYLYISKGSGGKRLYLALSRYPFLIGKRKTACFREAPPTGSRDAVANAGLLDSLYRQLEAYVKSGMVSETDGENGNME